MTAERVWVLADPRTGTAAQALGIAERLGEPFRTLPLAWSRFAALPIPWPSLAGLAQDSVRALHGAVPQARQPPGCPPHITADWPPLVLSAGRRSASVSRWLRRRGARTVHMMRPGFAARDFDLLVIGQHDGPPPAPNVVPILGAAHRVSPERLRQAHEEWAGLAALPPPRVALLVGGPVRDEGLAPAAAMALGARVASFAGSVLATASRRTGSAATEALAEALAAVPHRLHRWGGGGPNPLLGFMAWADAIVVTGDSVSMLSESLMTSAPVFVAAIGGEGKRHIALHESLYAAGQARPLADAPAPFARPPLDETGRIAVEIRARGLLR